MFEASLCTSNQAGTSRPPNDSVKTELMSCCFGKSIPRESRTAFDDTSTAI
ncbi:MAG: hypothetical protein JRM80_03220 [Nitrososphaerota archaeon]|nr:hypothetical protein [Nitrososphaerota archaeon]